MISVENMMKRFLVTVVVMAGLFLQSGCMTPDPVTGKNVYNMYTMEQEIKLGQDVQAQNTLQMKNQNVRIDADSSRVSQLSEMVRRIAAVADMPDLPYNVRLYHNDVVNASAAPGGSMMVFEGLYGPEGLVRPGDEDELAAVMAHEIAHVNCRHVTERLSKMQTAQALATVGSLAAAVEGEDDLAALIQGVFVVGSAIWVPTYTRRNEVEADKVGLFYMAAAGYDPRAAARIWRRAYDRNRKGEGGVLDMFNTHPSDRARYEALEAMMPYAMQVYADAKGGSIPGYTPPPGFQPDPNFNWRTFR